MPMALRRHYRAIVALLLLAVGVMLTASIDVGTNRSAPAAGPSTALDPPAFSASLTHGTLTVTGVTASAEHEAGLRQIIAEQFRGHDTRTDFRPGVIIGDYWIAASEQLVYALAAMDSAAAALGTDRVSLRGTTADRETLDDRLESLRQSMPASAVFEEDIIVLQTTASLDELCRRTFDGLVRAPVAFRQSSAEIRTSSYADLDKIIDFAFDCRHVRIAITGHSDASGSEAWNTRLALNRAQAVANYLARGGVPKERLIVESRGSSMPIAGNDTPYGRSMNRRIEFELRLPLL